MCGGVGGSHTHYSVTPAPRLGAGALMLNAWDWTVTKINSRHGIKSNRVVLKDYGVEVLGHSIHQKQSYSKNKLLNFIFQPLYITLLYFTIGKTEIKCNFFT